MILKLKKRREKWEKRELKVMNIVERVEGEWTCLFE